MACPWKCRSYLPTSRAIMQTSHEKGSFQIRSSMLFWNWKISWRTTVPGGYFQAFFNGAAHKNSFQGALPPTVGQSFLWADSSPPNLDGLTPTNNWAICQVGDDCGNLPTSSSHFASAILLMISSGSGRVSCAGNGGCTGDGDPWSSACTCALVLTSVLTCIWSLIIIPTSFLSSPCGMLFLFLPYWNLDRREPANQKAVWSQSHESYPASIWNFQLCDSASQLLIMYTTFLAKKNVWWVGQVQKNFGVRGQGI